VIVWRGLDDLVCILFVDEPGGMVLGRHVGECVVGPGECCGLSGFAEKTS